MRITDTIKKSKVKRQKAKLQFKIKNFTFYPVVFTLCFLFFASPLACAQQKNLSRAQEYARQAEGYYQQAITEYQNLIRQGKDLDRSYLELGKLYYHHGDSLQAIAALKQTQDKEAQKYLAIAYYRLGEFRDALEVFSRSEPLDDESLYYYGISCERLNLFDQALSLYRRIKEGNAVSLLADGRMQAIEKKGKLLNIKDIDPEVDKILKTSPAGQLYPQAGALILDCDERIEVTADNKEISQLHYLIKILNERGKESFAEASIGYDSTYEKVELEFARTIKPDGTVAEVGTRHIRDVSKYLNFPLYSNARVFIISFPEVSEGASIEYRVKIYRNQLINQKDFFLSYPLQSDNPIIRAQFVLKIPQNKTLRTKILNSAYNIFSANLKPRIDEKDGYIIYQWHFTQIPQIIPESDMPPMNEVNPTMLFSTVGNWQEIYNWWWNLAKSKLTADAAIKNKVQELTARLSDEEAKIRAIYNFCAKEIRYVAVEYGQAGYEPHSASDIFSNKYGDCKDQAVLLVTMLKEIGLAAYPVLIPTKDCYNLNPDFPSILFNHCIAALFFKGKLVFLDPTAETCSFLDLPAGDQGRKVLVFKEKNYALESTPLYPALHNRLQQDIELKVNPDESISVQRNIFTFGAYDQAQRYWLLYTPPELIHDMLQEKIQALSIGAKLEDYQIKNLKDLNKPVVLSYSFSGPEFFTPAGVLRIMPQLASLDSSLVAKEKRRYAIDFRMLESKEINFEIEIPESFVIKYIPASIVQDSPWLSYAAQYSSQGNKIYFKERLSAKEEIIAKEEYPEFKKFFNGLATQIKERVVLEKNQPTATPD